MADLIYEVDYATLKAANAELERMGKVSKTSASSFTQAYQQVVRWQEKFRTEQGKISAALETSYQKQKLANKSARESAQVFQQQAKEIERLSQKYKPLYAASQLYEKGLNEIDRAHKLGVLSVKQHTQAIDQLNAEYQAFQAGSTSALNRFNSGLSRTNRSLSHTSVITQQAGYQVGDFIVQVQSGTNAFVAFGQQATQVAGTLTLLGGKWIAIGSALGVAIPLVTAMAAAWMRTNTETRKTSDILSDLSGNLDTYISKVRESSEVNTNLIEKYGSVNRELIELEENLQRVTLRRIVLDAEAAALSLANFSIGLRGTSASLDKLFNLSDMGNLLNSLEVMTDLFKELENSQGPQQTYETLNKIEKAIVSATGGVENMNSSQLDFYEEVLKTKSEYERLLRVTGLVPSKISEATREAKGLGSILGGISISGLLEQMDILNSKLGSSIFNATTLLSKLGSAWTAAVALAKQKDSASKVSTDNLAAQYAQYGAGRAAFDRAAAEIRYASPKVVSTSSSGGGSGGGSKGGSSKIQEDYLKKLQEEADQKLKLVGLSEEEQRYQEIIYELKKKGLPVEEDRIKAILDTEKALKKAKEAEAAREQLMNSVTNNVESALMSLVEGTSSVEDAFKSMLRNILLEIYNQKVAKPLADSIGGFIGSIFGFSKGGVFSGGSQVQAFAEGGVVSSPTNFPMAGNKVGLMGEAGPEAIMPLKRGSNGKLGVQSEAQEVRLHITTSTQVDPSGNLIPVIANVSNEGFNRNIKVYHEEVTQRRKTA